MAVPKRRTSKSRIRIRQHSHSHKVAVPVTTLCSNCGAPRRPHYVCPACGFYRGRQVITIKPK